MARASDFDPRILAFDGYVHGRLTRRQFLDQATGLVAAGSTAAAVLANHGFHNDTTPRFDEDAAQLAWQRTVEFFDRQLR
jgi:dienelactone hydrolase